LFASIVLPAHAEAFRGCASDKRNAFAQGNTGQAIQADGIGRDIAPGHGDNFR
jgi:hypothetical protein